MKKYILIFALAAGALTSCETEKAEGTFVVDNYTADQLLEGATFSQYNAIKNEDGSVTYEPCEDGNYIKFSVPKVPSVDVYWVKNDGSEYSLSTGSNSGMVYYKPLRGSDPVQKVYFRYVNANLEEVVASKEFTLQVAQELSAGEKLLCSNSGSKKWKWYPTLVNGGAVWGNGGYMAGAQPGDANINGSWWGCGLEDGDCPDKFDGQLQHSANDASYLEECYSTSYMLFEEDGTLKAFGKDGNIFNTGSWQIAEYNNGEPLNDTGLVGYLNTSAGAILWPFSINTGGQQPTQFEIAYLSADRMILQYAIEGQSAWGESTWWSFGNNEDTEAFVTSTDWVWKPTNVNGGAVWGNAGYLAGDQTGDGNINGAWWGCGLLDGDCPDKFDGQLQHSANDASYLEECYSTSYMSFAEDGTLTAYGQDGKVFNVGSWSIDPTPNPDTFSQGTLSTSAGAILWPFSINTEGGKPTEFNIGYMSTSSMVLIYAAPGKGAWEECTWWSFGKK